MRTLRKNRWMIFLVLGVGVATLMICMGVNANESLGNLVMYLIPTVSLVVWGTIECLT